MDLISLEFLKINHNEKYLYANFLLAKKDIQFSGVNMEYIWCQGPYFNCYLGCLTISHGYELYISLYSCSHAIMFFY